MKRQFAHNHMQRSGSASEKGLGNLSGLLKSSLIGTGGGLLSCLLLLLIGTAICLCSANPHKIILPTGLAILYLCAIIGGFISARHHQCAPLPCGALCGALLLLVFLFVSFFLDEKNGHEFSLILSLLLRALIPFFSILGARIGLKQKKIHRRNKKK